MKPYGAKRNHNARTGENRRSRTTKAKEDRAAKRTERQAAQRCAACDHVAAPVKRRSGRYTLTVCASCGSEDVFPLDDGGWPEDNPVLAAHARACPRCQRRRAEAPLGNLAVACPDYARLQREGGPR